MVPRSLWGYVASIVGIMGCATATRADDFLPAEGLFERVVPTEDGKEFGYRVRVWRIRTGVVIVDEDPVAEQLDYLFPDAFEREMASQSSLKLMRTATTIETRKDGLYQDGSLVLKNPIQRGTEWLGGEFAGNCKYIFRISDVREDEVIVEWLSQCGADERVRLTDHWKRDRGIAARMAGTEVTFRTRRIDDDPAAKGAQTAYPAGDAGLRPTDSGMTK